MPWGTGTSPKFPVPGLDDLALPATFLEGQEGAPSP